MYALHTALQVSSIPVIHMLMFVGFPIITLNCTTFEMEQLRLASRYKKKGWKLIHYTVSKDYFPRIRKLCQTHPEEMESRTIPEGYTPLLMAAATGAVKSFLVLVQTGANDSARSSQGETAVQLAASSCHSDLLIEIMYVEPYTKERVIVEICDHLLKNISIEHVTNSLVALVAVMNHVSTIEHDCEGILIKTSEKIMERMVREKAIVPAARICEVIEIITPSAVDKVVNSRILLSLMSMKDAIDESSVTLHALQVLSKIVYHSPNIDAVLEIIGGPRAMVRALETHQAVPELQLVLMECIAHSGKSKKMAESLSKPELLNIIVTTLSNTADRRVLVSTAKALLSLTRDCNGLRECFIQTGGISVIMNVLKHSSIDTGIESVLILLKSLCNGDGVVERIVQSHPNAPSAFVRYTVNSADIKLRHTAFEIMWCIAVKNDSERVTLAMTLGPVCLLALIELGNTTTQFLALRALVPLTQPFHHLQPTVIDSGAILSLISIIRSNGDTEMRISCLKILENLSCGLANKPNVVSQEIFQSVNGTQLLLKIGCSNNDCSEHALCTLSSFSLKNKPIKTALLQGSPTLLTKLMFVHQKVDTNPSETESRTLCNLAYGSTETQSRLSGHGGIRLGSFVDRISIMDSRHRKVDTAFQIVVLARVFVDTKQSIATVFALKCLIAVLENSLTEGETDLQMHTAGRIGGLLLMRAGIIEALVSMDVVPLFVRMLLGGEAGPTRTAAVTLCILTTSPRASRVIVKCSRTKPQLGPRMMEHNCGHQPSRYFMENWISLYTSRPLFFTTTRYRNISAYTKYIVSYMMYIPPIPAPMMYMLFLGSTNPILLPLKKEEHLLAGQV